MHGIEFSKKNIPPVREPCCSEERKVIKFLDRKLFLGGEKLMKTDMVNFEKSLYIYLVFLAAQDALEVMGVTESLTE